MGLLKQLFGWGQMSSDDFLKRGVAHLKKREYDRAIADFSEAIQLDPKNCKTFLVLKQANAVTFRWGIFQKKLETPVISATS